MYDTVVHVWLFALKCELLCGRGKLSEVPSICFDNWQTQKVAKAALTALSAMVAVQNGEEVW